MSLPLPPQENFETTPLGILVLIPYFIAAFVIISMHCPLAKYSLSLSIQFSMLEWAFPWCTILVAMHSYISAFGVLIIFQ